MILTPQQAAAVLALIDAGGTGVLTFQSVATHEVVSIKTSGVIVAQFANGRAAGADQQEVYSTFDHFRLANSEPAPVDLRRTLAHYTEVARQAAERNGEAVLPEHRA